MSNSFYNYTGWPAQSAFGASLPGRTECQLIAAGFDKLPSLTASYIVRVNSGGTALESVAPATVKTAMGIELPDKITLDEQASVSTPAANKLVIYAKAVNNVAELFVKDENGNDIQLTSGGALNVSITEVALQPQSVAATESIDSPIYTGGWLAVSSSSGVVTLDLSLATRFTCTMTENVTGVTIINAPSEKGAEFTLEWINPSTYTFTENFSPPEGYTIYKPEGETLAVTTNGITMYGVVIHDTNLHVFQSNMEEATIG